MTTLMKNFYQTYYDEMGLPESTADFANAVVNSVHWRITKIGRQEV